MLTATQSASADPHGVFTTSTANCRLCHAPHSSPATDCLLSKPDEKRLCYSCHDGTQSKYDARSEFGESALGNSTARSHHPVPEDRLACRDCHTPHVGPSQGNAMALSVGPSALSTGTAVCGSCHGPATTLPEGDKSSAFVGTAHETSMTSGRSASGIACAACHAPHGSDNVSLLRRTLRSLGGVTQTVSVTSTAAGSTRFCLGCHDVIDGAFFGPATYQASRHATVTASTKALTSYPGAGKPAGDCENCHDPHGTGQPKMTRGAGDALCYTCHDATGTVKPPTYSYQGKSAYQASAHSSIVSTTVAGQLGLDASSEGFGAWESTTMPTPSSPGMPLSADKLRRLGSQDSSWAVTSLANVTGQHDFQTYRFKVPQGTLTSSARLAWAGYGEEFPGYETAVSLWSKSANGGAGGWVRFANGLFANQTAVATSFPSVSDYTDASGYLWMMADATKIMQSDIVGGPNIVNATSSWARVTWTTAGYADGWVDVGPTTLYGSVSGSGARSTGHDVVVPLPGPGRYHLRVRSTARDGDSTTSADVAFWNAVPVLSPVVVPGAPQQSFVTTLTWSIANPPVGCKYDVHVWSPHTGYDQTLTDVTTAQAVLTLPANYATWSLYYWQVRAKDVDGFISGWSATGLFSLHDSTYVPGGSCPFLFTWDGSRFAFDADLNTTGKLGEKTSSGYSAPDPTDRYVLPTVPASKDGALELRLVEERHEVDYTDRFKLFAVDLPLGVDVVAEKGERGRIGPFPPGGLHTTEKSRAPRAVRTDTAEDVTSLISATDDREVVLNEDRENFDYRTLELDLGDVTGAPQVKLVMNASTLRPLTQAGIDRQRTFGATTKLEVQDGSGAWRSVPASEASLPNAMEFARTYVFDITKAMHDTTGKIRLTYLFKTYVDSIAVDTSADREVMLTEVPMLSASLRQHGIDPHDRPGEKYEYAYTEGSERSYAFLPGSYTKYGDVTPLLRSADDEFVVYGPGDELAMRFSPLTPPAPGMHREYVTYSDGYYKGDKSAVTQTVDPLPFRAMSNYPYGPGEHYPDDAEHEAYRAEWNTRSSDDPTASPPAAPVSVLSTVLDAVRSLAARLEEALGFAPADPVAAAPVAVDPEAGDAALHRSLNTDCVSLELFTPFAGTKTGCVVCHDAHGGARSWDGSTPPGALLSYTGALCTGNGKGGCHSSSAASVSGVNVYAGVTASDNDTAHHDLTSAQQQRSGARTGCADCHDPHTETRTARFSDPATPSASLVTSLGPYVGPGGAVYALVASQHDGTPPVVSSLAIAGANLASTVLTPTVTWTTNEPATSWIDWGTSSGSYASSTGTDTLSTAHTVTLTGLALGQTYYWRVRTADAIGNVTTSAEGTYSTDLPPPVFTAGPTLMGSGWSNWSTPTVTWTTSDALTTVLEWGTSSGVYTSSSVDPARTTAHSRTTSPLATDTVYYWRVRGTDALGRTLTSAEATYLASPPPVPVVTLGPLVIGDKWTTYTTPTVIWNTSDLSSSFIEWGTSSGVYSRSAGSSSRATTHSVELTGLSLGTTYYIHAFGFDPVGRLVNVLETTYDPVLPTVPTITSGPGVASSSYADSSSPVVTWTTSDLTSSWVDWGTAPGIYTHSAGVDAQSTSHSCVITGLSYGTTYYYRVRGLDPGGRQVSSAEATCEVTTYPEPFSASAPASAVYDSGFGQYSTTVTFSAGTTIANGHPLEYRLYVDGSPASAWGTSTSWNVAMTGTTAGQAHPYFAVARDRTAPSRATTSSVGSITIIDYATWTGSCPFLYTWDGSRFAFGADINTTGKLGEKTSSGYSAPDPSDRYILPVVPASKDGELELRLVEERREVDYTDRFKLFAIDLPDGVDVVAEKGERGRIGPFPPGGLHTTDRPKTPATVRTDTGQDVTTLVSATDGSEVVLNDDRENFDYKTLELDLGDVTGAPQVKLVMHASSLRPLTAEGVARQRTFGATTKLEVQDTSGGWRSVPASEASLPNAMEMPRTYVFDITKAMHDTTGKIRLTYLFKTYIDSIKADTSADRQVTLTEVPMLSAKLGYHGIDPHDSPGDRFKYVYADSPAAHADLLPGYYTKYGDVTPLLRTADDEFVVYGPGDELAMRFSPLAPPAPGMHREYLTYSDSYYKGAKSAVTQTVEPLPFRAMSNYPYRADEHYPDDAEHQDYLSTWNTRSSADPTGGVSALRLPKAVTPQPVHYSVNTNAAVLGVTYFSDALTRLSPEAGWASTGATPTPSSPGAPASAQDLAKAASVDATSWVTDLAAAEGAYNYQVMRFSIPSSPTTSAVKSFSVGWTGHGEPTVGHPTSVYLWNNTAGRWDQVSSDVVGVDTTIKNVTSTTQSGFCLRCHTAAPPAGIKLPAGMVNVATAWTATTSAGDMHGDRGSGGFSGVLEPGMSRGSKGIPCMTCHDPHGNSSLYHIPRTVNDRTGTAVGTSAQAQVLCSACHTGSPAAWHVPCNDCHESDAAYEGHGGFGVVGVDYNDCLACHGHGKTFTHPYAGGSCHCCPDGQKWRSF